MNPFCPDCGKIMEQKTITGFIGTEEIKGRTIVRKGNSKFWVCKKCHNKYRIGNDLIVRRA